MKARYRLAPAAQQDIREHWHYIGIANHSPDAADRVVDLFFEKFELFATHPEIGELAHDFQDIRPGMRLTLLEIGAEEKHLGAKNVDDAFSVK